MGRHLRTDTQRERERGENGATFEDRHSERERERRKWGDI